MRERRPFAAEALDRRRIRVFWQRCHRNPKRRAFRARPRAARRQQSAGRLRAHRLAEGEALRVFAAHLVELDRVGVGLGAFRHDVHAEIVSERDDRAQDHRPRALAVVRTNDWSILMVSNGKRCR